jgi:hypothetical protein
MKNPSQSPTESFINIITNKLSLINSKKYPKMRKFKEMRVV